MARQEKLDEVQAITDKIQNAQSIVLTNYAGLTVEQMTKFRNECREKQVQCRVVKNRLARIACTNVGFDVLSPALKGPVAMVIGTESQVDPAKLVMDFAKVNKAMDVIGGMVDGMYLDETQVASLSKIPGRDELYAKMMGSINSPASGIVGTITGVTAALCRTIDAVAKQKAESA
jgi:large subunit ribosomal protein L10